MLRAQRQYHDPPVLRLVGRDPKRPADVIVPPLDAQPSTARAIPRRHAATEGELPPLARTTEEETVQTSDILVVVDDQPAAPTNHDRAVLEAMGKARRASLVDLAALPEGTAYHSVGRACLAELARREAKCLPKGCFQLVEFEDDDKTPPTITSAWQRLIPPPLPKDEG